MKRLTPLFSALALAVAAMAPAEPTKTHPRLWIRSEDLPTIRGWATNANPFWKDGLSKLIQQSDAMYAANQLKTGDNGYSPNENSVEMHAMLFAFTSLLQTDQAARDAYAEKARDLLMFAVDQASQGHASAPFRYDNFAKGDRSFLAESFPLTVDWIYPYLTASDKAKIRKTFLLWADDCIHSYEAGENSHPEPFNTYNDPALFQLNEPGEPVTRSAIRWALNNHYVMHMRSVGMFPLALDPADDVPNAGVGDSAPAGALTGYTTGPGGPTDWAFQNTGMIRNATGAWLYVNDYAQKNEAKGGLSPEGTEYWTLGFGACAQLRLCLYTAGQEDVSTWGPQVDWSANPFWDKAIEAYQHLMAPKPDYLRGEAWRGRVWFPTVFGDSYWIYANEAANGFGPVGLYDWHRGNTTRLRKIRWLLRNLGQGAGDDSRLLNRIQSFISNVRVRDGIYYFLLFDPNDSRATEIDQRPSLPTDAFVPFTDDTGVIMARTSWAEDANYFTHYLGYARIDHQMGEGGSVEFWRKGQWLTKRWVGYGPTVGSSDFRNTLAIETDPIPGATSGQQYYEQLRGSQFGYSHRADPAYVARSMQPGYVYATSDLTNMYNWRWGWEQTVSTACSHASRSVAWLKPDHIVLYDRVESTGPGYFKQFWLSLPEDPVLSADARSATMTALSYDPNSGAPVGPTQLLHVTSLLPANGAFVKNTDLPLDPSGGYNEGSQQEIIKLRLRMEAPGDPPSARFLNVLQGADLGVPADPATVLASSSGTPFDGVAVGGRAVLFPFSLSTPFTGTTVSLPGSVGELLVTGLQANGSYSVSAAGSRTSSMEVTIAPGGPLTADEGGVLDWLVTTPSSIDGWLVF